MSKGFIGWAAVVETGEVYYLGTDYATKASAEKNAQRCIGDYLQIPGCTLEAVRFYGLDEKERCIEDAEAWAADHSTIDADRCYSVVSGGAIPVKKGPRKAAQPVSDAAEDHPQGCIADIAEDYGAMFEVVRELFDCYMEIVGGMDYEEEAAGFREVFDCMRMGKAVA